MVGDATAFKERSVSSGWGEQFQRHSARRSVSTNQAVAFEADRADRF